jgi:hypothetical protein
MKFNKYFRWLKAATTFLLAGLVFLACGSKDLSIRTIRWQSDGNGFFQFYTNDPQYLGYSFPSYYNVSNTTSASYSIETKKISGKDNTGYGMIFGVDSNNYFIVYITVNGRYKISVRTGEKYTTVKDWSSSPDLRIGYSQSNAIRILKSGSRYTVYFKYDINNPVTTITNFTDFTDTYFNGTINRIGFIAGVSTEESFPNTPC